MVLCAIFFLLFALLWSYTPLHHSHEHNDKYDGHDDRGNYHSRQSALSAGRGALSVLILPHKPEDKADNGEEKAQSGSAGNALILRIIKPRGRSVRVCRAHLAAAMSAIDGIAFYFLAAITAIHNISSAIFSKPLSAAPNSNNNIPARPVRRRKSPRRRLSPLSHTVLCPQARPFRRNGRGADSYPSTPATI